MFREWSDRLNAYDDIELCICVTQDETGRYAVGSLTSEGRLRTSLHAPGSTLLGLVLVTEPGPAFGVEEVLILVRGIFGWVWKGNLKEVGP